MTTGRPKAIGVVALLGLGVGLLLLSCAGSSGGSPASTLDGGREARAEDAATETGRDARTDAGKRAEAGLDGGDDPKLLALSVSAADAGDASAYTLAPTFSPTTYDYYVRCGAGVNSLTVTMTASPGALSRLTQPTSSPSLPSQTLSVAVDEGAAIVANAVTAAATTPYWIRCLPHDFPVLRWEPHPEAGAPPPGYYLVGGLDPVDGGAFAMALNGDGVPVWFQAAPGTVANVDDIVDGSVSFYSYDGWEIRGLEAPAVDYLPTHPYDQHDLRALPNGDYLITSAPMLTGVDLTGYDVVLADGGTLALGPNSAIQECQLLELTPTGEVVWTWTGSEHLDPVKDCTTYTLVPSLLTADGGAVADPFHCNSVDVDPETGDLLVSGRFMDSVFYVDRRTSKILWKMGGKSFTKDDAAYVPVPDAFHGQHDARLQPGWRETCGGGAGQVSVYDDETGHPGPARAALYDVEVRYGQLDGSAGGGGADCGASGDAGASAATIRWQRAGTRSAPGVGSFRISADGSRVIAWGGGDGPVAFTEVDDSGAALLDFTMLTPADETTYRAIKVPLASFPLAVLRATAGTAP